MIWVKAIDRLPEVMLGESKSFFCRNTKYMTKSILWYGKSNRSYLVREPRDWEWLDEEFKTDFDKGFEAAKSDIQKHLDSIKSKNHPA